MSKKAKQLQRLLKQKTLTSEEAIRLLELDGWYPDPVHPQDGSHKYFKHRVKKGKPCVPDNRNPLKTGTHDKILKDAGLWGR